MRPSAPTSSWTRRGLFALVLAISVAASVGDRGEPRAQESGQPQVYLLRGLADVFSLGLDSLAGELRANGIPAAVHNHLASGTVAQRIIAAHRRDRGSRPIVLVGHSLGASAAVRVTGWLEQEGVPVDLLVLLGLPRQVTLPGNVAHVINIQPSGAAQFVTRGPGFRGRLDNIDMNSRADLRAGPSNHFTLEANRVLHRIILDAIRRAMRRA